MNGLNSINLLTDQVKSHKSSQHKNSLSLNLILKIYKDNSKNMWLGTNGGGINTFSSLNLLMPHGLVDYSNSPINVIGFAEASNEKLWAASDSGALYYFKHGEPILEKQFQLDNLVSQLLIDENDNLWLKTETDSHIVLATYLATIQPIKS